MSSRTMVQKTFELGSVKQAGDRRRRFTISTSDVDRDGDRIQFWELDAYRRNPVVLYAHENRHLPIAKTVEIGVQRQRLRAVAEWPVKGVSEFSDTVLGLVDAGVLNAASIGFIPLEPIERNEFGGFDYGAELTEWSVVPVPANAGALIERAKAVGVDVTPLLQERRRHLQRCAGGLCPSPPDDPFDGLLSCSSAELRAALEGPVGEAVWKHITATTGRLGP